MPSRNWFRAIIHPVSLFFFLQAPMFAQQEPITADQIVSRYEQAIGADRFSSITTFVESGDLFGNLTSFWQGSRSPGQSSNRQRGTFEFYFKSPNLRFNSSVTENNRLIGMRGCEGKLAWYIDPYLKRTEFKPKPGSEYDCKEGLEPASSRLRLPGVKMRLLKKKDIEDHPAWEIRVEYPKSPGSVTYYFDAETFLLVRMEEGGSSVTYSDYRDVGGIKLAFTTVNEFTNSKLVTTLREVKINIPIDDAEFAERQVKNGIVTANPNLSARKNDVQIPNVTPAESATANPDITNIAHDPPATSNAATVMEVNFPNFTSCTVAELQLTIPELAGLKPAEDQETLGALLDKVGAKTLEIARNTPNLISRETVTELQGAKETHRDYDYLILARIQGTLVGLDEFRLDLKSGDKFQTDEITNKESRARADLERASLELAARSGRPPMSQGFATSWVHFYPTNRSQATFRYLGEQKMDSHRTLVVAFAQKPASVLLPAIVQYQGKTVPMFLQGVAWIDPSDFRILRLRTDLLAPVPEVSLHRLTADIQFGLTRIEQIPSPLSLPREVAIISELGGSTEREIHKYSGYRLFRAKSRIVLNP